MNNQSLYLSYSITLFFIMDPFGTIGLIASLIKPFSLKKQLKILVLENLLAFVILVLFYYLGTALISLLGIHDYAMHVAGGIVLISFSLHLLFPEQREKLLISEPPFLVPIAMPLIAGPTVLAAVIYLAQEPTDTLVTLSALLTAWLGSAVIVLLSPFLNQILSANHIKVLEQISGLVCAFVGCKILTEGIQLFAELHLSGQLDMTGCS